VKQQHGGRAIFSFGAHLDSLTDEPLEIEICVHRQCKHYYKLCTKYCL